jgi:hypothetical protein
MEYLKIQMDNIMGKDRNKSAKEIKMMQESYNTPDVCKYFLVSFCPHDLFPNTKQDLGTCMKRHDEKFKLAFDADTNRVVHEMQYIKDYISNPFLSIKLILRFD